jgi:hypothetical protein
VETHPESQERGDPTADLYGACRRLINAGEDPEQGRFSGAVRANDREGLAWIDGDAYIPEHPESLGDLAQVWPE